MIGWDAAGAIGSVIGGIGGLAGFLALFMQRNDAKARKRVAHLPPELRPLLLEIAAVCGQVQSRPRDREWVEEHVTPLVERYRPLADLVIAANKNDGGTFALLGANLEAVCVYTASEYQSPAEVAHYATKQTNSARGAIETAHTLLRKFEL